MTFSRLSAAWVGLVVGVPGLLISACSDDATQPATNEPCTGQSCAGADPGSAGKKADGSGGSATNGGTKNQTMGGDAAGGMTMTVDPTAGADNTGEGGASAGNGAGGNDASGGAPPEPQVKGTACDETTLCESGYCVDGVCCESSCDAGCFSCKGVETGGGDGACLPVLTDTDPGDDCAGDAATCLADTCNGSGVCKKAEDGTVCRPADGDCDSAETCTSGACPSDLVKGNETTCRAAAGSCDLAETCNGQDKNCPSDAFSNLSVEACPGYKCSGSSAACPTTCETKADCSSARFCLTNQCIPGKRVFVTSTAHPANFGALTNADAICNTRAQAAGLFGTYMAWVSSTTSNIATRSTHSTYKYYRLDGTTPMIVANDWADLIDGTTVAIATDEFGQTQGYVSVFTGTESNGVAVTPQNNCSNWSTVAANVTFATGNSSAAATNVPNWSHYWNYNCDVMGHFYCIQQ